MFLAITKQVLATKREQQHRLQNPANDTVRLGAGHHRSRGKKNKCCWKKGAGTKSGQLRLIPVYYAVIPCRREGVLVW